MPRSHSFEAYSVPLCLPVQIVANLLEDSYGQSVGAKSDMNVLMMVFALTVILFLGFPFLVMASSSHLAEDNGTSPYSNPSIYMILLEDGIKPDVSVLNIKNNTVVQTGMIIGTASHMQEVIRVDVKLDSGDYTPAVGTTSWQFKLPTGADTWKDDSRHTVRVRALNRSGNYSDPITLTVRKGANKDINCDGYGDLIVGASGQAALGSVFIYYGGASGIADTDLGARLYNLNQGHVYGFYSNGSQIPNTDLNQAAADFVLTGESGNGEFGGAAVLIDCDGDASLDLAVGAQSQSFAKGRVYVFYNSGSGFPDIDLSAGDSADTTLTGPSFSYFGETLADE